MSLDQLAMATKLVPCRYGCGRGVKVSKDFDGIATCSICIYLRADALEPRIEALQIRIAFCMANRQKAKAKRLEKDLNDLLVRLKDIKGTTDISSSSRLKEE